jgi:5,10-methylene-tetrahydrofolate dehydrogenase/methenyl tetrahydrofolate cyclohydrolase
LDRRAVVLVGDDPARAVYVSSKARQTLGVGMRSFEHRVPFPAQLCPDHVIAALTRRGPSA